MKALMCVCRGGGVVVGGNNDGVCVCGGEKDVEVSGRTLSHQVQPHQV